MPSRDMIVREVTPPGSFGKVFGFVTTGFNIGGIVSPLIFGAIMDHGSPRLVFLAGGRLQPGRHPDGGDAADAGGPDPRAGCDGSRTCQIGRIAPCQGPPALRRRVISADPRPAPAGG